MEGRDETKQVETEKQSRVDLGRVTEIENDEDGRREQGRQGERAVEDDRETLTGCVEQSRR
jgi:hypothetical protein